MNKSHIFGYMLGLLKHPVDDTQIERIKQMEQRFNKVLTVIKEPTKTPVMLEAIKEDVTMLEAYYGSKLWKQDFAADEAGNLPPDLKRGVLSEDGIWNLLTEYRELTINKEEI